jgi:hypothetical protein
LRLALVIDIGNLLPVGVTHNEAVGRDFGCVQGGGKRRSGIG